MPKIVNSCEFFENLNLAVNQCYQTGNLIGQQLVENAKTKKLKCDIVGIFNHCASMHFT